jgi:hypothetical protein
MILMRTVSYGPNDSKYFNTPVTQSKILLSYSHRRNILRRFDIAVSTTQCRDSVPSSAIDLHGYSCYITQKKFTLHQVVVQRRTIVPVVTVGGFSALRNSYMYELRTRIYPVPEKHHSVAGFGTSSCAPPNAEVSSLREAMT